MGNAMTYLSKSLAAEVRGREPLLRPTGWFLLGVLIVEIIAVML